MSDEQLKYEQIERYLSGAMSAQERADFEQALSADRALAEEVALHRIMKQSLGNPARRKLLDALSEVSAPEMSVAHRTPLLRVATRRWLAAAAGVLVLLAAGLWWFLRQPDGPPAIVEKPSPQPSLSPAPADAPVSRPDTPSTPAPHPYLAANFTPNPALDPLVGEHLRSAGAAIEVEQPRADANFIRENDRIAFRLKGRTDKSVTALTLRVFSNRERDFIAGKSIVQAELSTPDGLIDWNNKWKLPPGRYYVVLTVAGEEEPGAVLRFFVEK